MLKSKKQKALAGVLAIGMLGASGFSARAIDLGKLFGNLGTMSTELQNSPLLKDALSFYNDFGNTFSTAIQNYTTLPQTAIGQLLGGEGQFAPTDTKNETERKSDPKNLLDLNTKQGTAALATNELAGQQVLSKPAQEGIKKANQEMADLDKLTVDISDDVYFASKDALQMESSQDVLKTISGQLSGQADIAAAQTRLSVIQNSSMQNLKMNTAALNVAAASQLERDMGKNQAEKISQVNNQAAQANVVWRNMLLPTQ
jgi:hypothetical protein